MKRKGFTLIELMVVIVIIITLTSFVVIAVDIARKRTRDTIIISSLEQIQALAETTYNPNPDKKDGYKELYNMREGADHHLKEISDKIETMGKSMNLFFPHDSTNKRNDYSEYCAYVRLFMNENEIFCVDSTGKGRKVDISEGKRIHCMNRESAYDNCEYD
jgi:prepilin-type N-terminal cleavage/methylation domain-containing protein